MHLLRNPGRNQVLGFSYEKLQKSELINLQDGRGPELGSFSEIHTDFSWRSLRHVLRNPGRNQILGFPYEKLQKSELINVSRDVRGPELGNLSEIHTDFSWRSLRHLLHNAGRNLGFSLRKTPKIRADQLARCARSRTRKFLGGSHGFFLEKSEAFAAQSRTESWVFLANNSQNPS